MPSVFHPRLLVNRADQSVLIEPYLTAINVKSAPYNAVGNGIADDGPAIQAALDAALGGVGNPNGEQGAFSSKPIFFPAGVYNVGQQLFINYGVGAVLLGAGQHATRLVYTGPNSQLTNGNITALMTARSMQYSLIQGITFDATGSNANVCFALQNYLARFTGTVSGHTLTVSGVTGKIFEGSPVGSWLVDPTVSGFSGDFPAGLSGNSTLSTPIVSQSSYTLTSSGNIGPELMGAAVQSDGTGNMYVDCAFIGGSRGGIGDGFLAFAGSGQLGSEEQFRDCTFDSCVWGLSIGTDNALDYSVRNCVFKNNAAIGIRVVGNAGCESIQGCYFHNNTLDIFLSGNNCSITGCYSDSTDFICAGPVWIVGCYHTGTGRFWSDNPTAIGAGGPAYNNPTIEGCYSAGTILGNGSASVYLRGNKFTNANIIKDLSSATNGATFTGTISSGTTLVATGVSGFIILGEKIRGTGVNVSTRITGQVSGPDEGDGTYTIAQTNGAAHPNVGPIAMVGGGLAEYI
jgi:hypothetical protein